MASMEGKVIALTGAASGIGLATARLLASRGAILSVADVNQAGLEEAVQTFENSSKHLTTVVDVRESSQINNWIENTAQKLGKLDGAANIAGVGPRGKTVADALDEDWDFIMNINGRGVFYCMRAELNNMKDGGSIVNVSSVAGIRGIANTSIYVASKHAVAGMTKSAARENGHRHIRINAIAPGVIDTPMVQNIMAARRGGKMDTSSQCLDRAAQPEEMANVIAFMLSDEASFVTGSIWSADGGWHT